MPGTPNQPPRSEQSPKAQAKANERQTPQTLPKADQRTEDPRRTLGRLGEELAVTHLRRMGFALLERNARTRHGEIDVIAFDGRTLVFVEVKTRRSLGSPRKSCGPEEHPLAALRPRQRARLRRLAAAWLYDETHVRPTAHTIRFDAIGVTVDARNALVRLDHVEGAW
ncbi:MAG TPA: YraN family protein [Solirubrobacteraceae bacterium]|jgi:putative endonuclease